MRYASLFAAVAFAAACDPPPQQGSAFIEGFLQFGDPPDCEVNETDDVSVKTPLLDVGGAVANSLVLALKVRSNLPSTGQQAPSASYVSYGASDNNIITFTNSEVFFSTDGDRRGEPALTNASLNGEVPRVAGVTGVAFNEGLSLLKESVILMTAITSEDATALKEEPFIATVSGLSDVKRVRITVNLLLEGLTSGNAPVRTAPFPVGVELCIGCLIPLQCPVGTVALPANAAGVCHRGQDDLFECR